MFHPGVQYDLRSSRLSSFSRCFSSDELRSAFALASWSVQVLESCVVGHGIAEDIDRRLITMLVGSKLRSHLGSPCSLWNRFSENRTDIDRIFLIGWISQLVLP